MKEAGSTLGLLVVVYGPETHITAIVPMALAHIDPGFSYAGEALQADGAIRGPPPGIDIVVWSR